MAMKMKQPHLLAALLLSSTGCASVPSEPDRLNTHPELREYVRAAREAAGLPALAVAVADSEAVLFDHADGTRVLDGHATVTTADRFHIGSVTKPITATMIARLVDKGVLGWEITPADVWPANAQAMHPLLRNVTVEQLLSHRAGLAAFETDEENATFPRRDEAPREERKRFALWLLTQQPAFAVGEHVYSNAGYGLVAAMAEQVTALSWEELVEREVFRPLGLQTCGFGWPSQADQPSGHRLVDGRLQPHDLDDGYRLSAAIAPAGDVHCSVGDVVRFGQAHLKGLHQRTGYLRPATFEKLHEAPEGEYALGWNVRKFGSHHLGSAGAFTANLIVFGTTISSLCSRQTRRACRQSRRPQS
jgi:CubicO group peptidase (beta-lactamase class C family)